MSKHENCQHGDGNAWTITPSRRYFKRCDTCGTWRLWADYREVYYVDDDREETCWWWECTTCIIKTISDYAEVWELELEDPPDLSAGEVMVAEAELRQVRHEENMEAARLFPSAKGHRGGMKSVAVYARSLGADLPWGEEYDTLKECEHCGFVDLWEQDASEDNITGPCPGCGARIDLRGCGKCGGVLTNASSNDYREQGEDPDDIYDTYPVVWCPSCHSQIDLKAEAWRIEDGPCKDGKYYCLGPRNNDMSCCGCGGA